MWPLPLRLFCALLLVFTACCALDPPPPGVTIFEKGQAGYSCHRVPGAINTGKSLLVFVESRRSSCDDQAPKDVSLRRSTNGGQTWSPLIRVLGDTIGTGSQLTYRNPTPVHYQSPAGSGTVILNVVNSSVGGTWPSLQLQSTDDGLTWSVPERVLGMGAYEGVLAGPGSGIQLGAHSEVNRKDPKLRNRILYCGATGYQAGRQMDAVIWYSDDGAKSFSVSPSEFREMQECQMTELANGTLMINFRNAHLNKSCDCRAVSFSVDGGVSWSLPVRYDPVLIEPVCSAGLINVNTEDGENLLFFSNPADTSRRDKMTVRRSDDSGGSWAVQHQIWAGPAAYSVLLPINQTHVGLVFENGRSSPYERISFVALPHSLARTP